MIDDNYLLARLQDREDNFTERKSDGLSVREIRKTAAAFANTVDGGDAILFIGVHDRTGAITGVRDPDELQRRIRQSCHEDCYPPIQYTSRVLHTEGKPIVAVVVPPSNAKPHFTGPAFVRIGSESVKASMEQLEELVLSRIDKCREILRHKGKGLVTVRGVGYKLGSQRPLADAHYLQQTECLIVGCTAHTVTLEEPASGRTFSESLRGVEIVRDHQRLGRLMLIVQFPRP